jgi:hypothetical protein
MDNSIVLTHHRPTTDHWLNFIANSPNKKHWRVRSAIHIINQEISDLRFNALKKVGGQYCQYLMNREANFLDKQLREALS